MLDRIAIDFADRVPQPPVKVAVRELSVTATDFTNARGGRMQVALRAQVGPRGRLAFTGPVTAIRWRSTARSTRRASRSSR